MRLTFVGSFFKSYQPTICTINFPFVLTIVIGISYYLSRPKVIEQFKKQKQALLITFQLLRYVASCETRPIRGVFESNALLESEGLFVSS